MVVLKQVNLKTGQLNNNMGDSRKLYINSKITQVLMDLSLIKTAIPPYDGFNEENEDLIGLVDYISSLMEELQELV